MSKPYALKPVLDKKRNKRRLDLPPAFSPSGKRERHLFERHPDALAEANRIKQTFRGLWPIGANVAGEQAD
ncbi:MAG TPA: hypothetical protein VIS99_05710 [Terrimicrobiaceae bacterium]